MLVCQPDTKRVDCRLCQSPALGAALEFDEKPQADAAGCGELVLAQAELLALVPNDAAYRGTVVHPALHFPIGKTSADKSPLSQLNRQHAAYTGRTAPQYRS